MTSFWVDRAKAARTATGSKTRVVIYHMHKDYNTRWDSLKLVVHLATNYNARRLAMVETEADGQFTVAMMEYKSGYQLRQWYDPVKPEVVEAMHVFGVNRYGNMYRRLVPHFPAIAHHTLFPRAGRATMLHWAKPVAKVWGVTRTNTYIDNDCGCTRSYLQKMVVQFYPHGQGTDGQYKYLHTIECSIKNAQTMEPVLPVIPPLVPDKLPEKEEGVAQEEEEKKQEEEEKDDKDEEEESESEEDPTPPQPFRPCGVAYKPGDTHGCCIVGRTDDGYSLRPISAYPGPQATVIRYPVRFVPVFIPNPPNPPQQ